ncbi:MAG: hypothetical protein WA344_22460 [Ralstonia pickettii]
MSQKTFACGHIGKGQFCHRCAQLAQENAAKIQRSADDALKKQHWQSQLNSAPVPLNHLPKEIARKALQVFAALAGDKTYLDVKGKRLAAMGLRQIVSIPLGLSHRLVCREEAGKLSYLEALTHEEYNNRLAAGTWK